MKNSYFKSNKRKLTSEGESFSMIDHKAYVYYRESSELANRELVAHYVEYGKLISEFYEIVSDEIADSKGGVFIENFGYFGLMKHNKPRKIKRNKEGEKVLDLDDNFFIAFVPISKNNKRRMYTFDLGFSKKCRNKIKKRLREGYRYLFNASLFYHKLKKNRNE